MPYSDTCSRVVEVVGPIESSCTLPGFSVQCPDVGPHQGQSQLLQCGVGLAGAISGTTDFGANDCTATSEVAFGATTTCGNIDFDTCSSSCTITNESELCGPFGGVCVPVPGACTLPRCQLDSIQCTPPIRTASRSISALCMKVEPVVL